MKKICINEVYSADTLKEVANAINSLNMWATYYDPNDGNEYEVTLDDTENALRKKIVIILYADRHTSVCTNVEEQGAKAKDFRIYKAI